jgi:hypothetical protein
MKKLALALALPILLLLLIPTTDYVAPHWIVTVTDTSGHPIRGASVAMMSEQYTLEKVDVEVDKVTDANGQVNFDERKIRANALRRAAGVIWNIASQGTHASFGVHTHVVASSPGYGEPAILALFAENEQASRATGEKEKTSHFTLLKCDTGYSGFGCAFPTDPEQPVKPLPNHR